MSLLDKMEYRFGRHAIPNLMRYIAGLNGLCFILLKLHPRLFEVLYLSPQLVLQGQVWRLVTYMFIPQMGFLMPDWLGAAFYLYFLWWIGDGLEHALGAFRLNLYYLVGMIGVTVAAMVTMSGWAAFMLNSSLFFAFARFFPDEVIFIMYIIPAKVKWISWVAAVAAIYYFLTGDWDYRLALLATMANYFLFFGKEIVQGARVRAEVAERRRKFEKSKEPVTATLHECVVCHRTEASHPDLDFRVSSQDGQEYCRDHLPKAASAQKA
ncbi:MAG TPA: hypothetical protein VHY22_01805 [Chthoniobacteraceae bacterium]|nr:hypothetical protein [Chthoniobacteraceae bacterium]